MTAPLPVLATAGSLWGNIGQLSDLVAASRIGQESQSPAQPALRVAAQPMRAPASPKPPSEPKRLRKLAETAFAPARAPVKKAVNSRASDAGWEEF